VAPRSEDPKLIIRVINFELVRPTYVPMTYQRYRQTDRRTTYDSSTALALRASRGKNAAMKLKLIKVPIAKSKFAQMSTNQ